MMTEPRKQFISNLKVGSEVETEVLVVEAQMTNYTSANRAGEKFLRLILGDKSGTIRGIIWDVNKLNDEIKSGDILSVRGDVNDYHGPQIIVKEAYKINTEDVDRRLFQPVAKRDIDEMFLELTQIIENDINDPFILKLMAAFFDDPVFVKKFKETPAAKTIHHNYIGGLLEHSLETAWLCKKIAGMHPEQINKSILISGAVLHDIGKMEEYDSNSFNFELTDKGKLIGHITLGKDLLQERIDKIENFPSHLKLELEHIILSHHGQREWGSPEIPKTIHAFAVFHADLLGARLNQFITVMGKSSSGESDWTDWDRYLERSIFIKKNLTE